MSNTVAEYIEALADDRRAAVSRLRDTINAAIPPGFQETMSYGMIGWVVPHTLYPKGYHCSPHLPLPFLSIASQKGFVGLYHMGLYADPVLYEWFTDEYAARVPTKLDAGKSCIRFKKLDAIPYDLVAELCGRMTVEAWVARYEAAFRRS